MATLKDKKTERTIAVVNDDTHEVVVVMKIDNPGPLADVVPVQPGFTVVDNADGAERGGTYKAGKWAPPPEPDPDDPRVGGYKDVGWPPVDADGYPKQPPPDPDADDEIVPITATTGVTATDHGPAEPVLEEPAEVPSDEQRAAAAEREAQMRASVEIKDPSSADA